MSRDSGRSRTYREYSGTRRESLTVFTPEREPTLRERRRRMRSDLGDVSCFRRWADEDDGSRNPFLRWGRQLRAKRTRGGPSHSRGRRYCARSEWKSDNNTGRGDGGADLSYTDLRWHLHQRRRSQPENCSPGRRDRQDAFEGSVSPRRLSDKRKPSSVMYEDTATCSTYEDLDKHDDLCPEYQRYWNCVVAEMEVHSDKRVDSKVEVLSDISDDSLVDPLYRASPKVKSLIMREEACSRTPKRHYPANNDIHNSPTPGFDNSKQHLSQKVDSNTTGGPHLEKKPRLSPGQIKPSNTDRKAAAVRGDCSSSSGSSSSSSSSSSSDSSECKRRDSCSYRRRMLPPEATSSSLNHSTRALSASRRGCREEGGVDDTSFINPTLEASILSNTDLSSSSATLSSSVLSSSTDPFSSSSSSATLSSSVLSSSLYSSSDNGYASLLASPESRDPRRFALVQLGRLMRWVLSSSMQRYMPSVRPPQLTGMQVRLRTRVGVIMLSLCFISMC